MLFDSCPFKSLNEPALYSELESKRIFAALDVFSDFGFTENLIQLKKI